MSGNYAGINKAGADLDNGNPVQRAESETESPPELDGYVSYDEMREVQSKMGELLHRMIDVCLAITAGPSVPGKN